MVTKNLEKRRVPERIFHALAFECVATAILAPVTAWITGHSMFETGMLVVLLATIAFAWNLVYNMIFDRLWPVMRVKRTLKVRTAHAVGFEGGFMFVSVGLIAWMLDMGFIEALMTDIGMVLFFLPYTMAFNWIYDIVRARIVYRERRCSSEVRQCRR